MHQDERLFHTSVYYNNTQYKERKNIEKKEWFSGLQSLKGILFILVFLSHCGWFFPTYNLWGGAAVATFFLLSGFLTGYFYSPSATQEPLILQCIKTAWKKIKRFYPLYFIMLTVAALYVRKGSLVFFIENLFLIQSYFGSDASKAFTGSGWFLSSIMLCFVLSPMINRIYNSIKLNPLIHITIIILLQFLLATIFSSDSSPNNFNNFILYIFPPVRLLDFIEGILLSKLFIIKRKSISKLNKESINIIEQLTLLIYIFFLIRCNFVPQNYSATFIWIIPSMLVIWIFASNTGRITNKCSKNKILQYLGNKSFELFIVHYLVLFYFAKLRLTAIAVILAFIVTVLVAELYNSLVNLINTKTS